MARAGGKDRGLFEKRPGEWWIQYHDETGRKRRKKGGTKSQARELYAFRKAGVHRRRKGFEPEARKRRHVPTLREAWENYREERDASLRRPDHDRLYQRYWTDLYGHLRLDELKADELHRWRSRRLREVKASTVNRALTYLQAIYSLAIRDELVEVNPMSWVGKLDEEKRNRVLSEEEEARLRQALPWARRHFEDPCRRLGILDINWHDLRHTCATRMLERGCPWPRPGDPGAPIQQDDGALQTPAAQHLRAALQLLVSTPNGHQNGRQSTMLTEETRQHGHSSSDI